MDKNPAALEQIAEDAQYALGSFDAIAVLLAMIARQIGLDPKDLNGVIERGAIYHGELEGCRATGYNNVVDTFRSAYERGPL